MCALDHTRLVEQEQRQISRRVQGVTKPGFLQVQRYPRVWLAQHRGQKAHPRGWPHLRWFQTFAEFLSVDPEEIPNQRVLFSLPGMQQFCHTDEEYALNTRSGWRAFPGGSPNTGASESAAPMPVPGKQPQAQQQASCRGLLPTRCEGAASAVCARGRLAGCSVTADAPLWTTRDVTPVLHHRASQACMGTWRALDGFCPQGCMKPPK